MDDYKFKVKVISFLADIGIETRAEKGANGFIPGVLIDKGVIAYDIEVASVADLLHETGHLAITPPEYRPLMSKGLIQGLKLMFDSIEQREIMPDSPMYRAIIQCSDPEATAWAWAAGLHLELPPELIIDSEAYDGTGDEIRSMLQFNAYLGINGLSHGGMCVSSDAVARHRGVEAFPKMLRWLQPPGLSETTSALVENR